MTTLATPRLTQFLLIALGNGATEGERINAIGQLQRELKKADCDAHDLVKRLALTEQQAQQILDAGIARGRAEELENARRNTVTTAAPSVAGDVGRGVGSYTWLQIARHCASNTHRLNDWERRFIASVSRRLLYDPSPSPKEAAKLHQIFYERFGERME